MENILKRDWFSRMWTVQEVVMAQEPLVVCGRKAIRWNNLFWGIMAARVKAGARKKSDFSVVFDSVYPIYTFWLELSRVSEFRESKHRNWVAEDSALFGYWTAFLDFMEESGQIISRTQLAVGAATIAARVYQGLRPLNSTPLSMVMWLCAATMLLTPPPRNDHWDDKLRDVLVDVLNSSRNQQSTEPKDKVYALYGLLQALGVELPQPNYSEEHSLEDAYLGFTRSIIKWHYSLDVLLEASGPWGSNAPSWVPDWSRSYKRLQFPTTRVSGGRIPQINDSSRTFSEDHRELTASGKRMGKVVFRADSLEDLTRVRDATQSRISSVQGLKQLRNEVATLRQWLLVVRDFFLFPMDKVCQLLASIPTLRGIHTDHDLHSWVDIILRDDLKIARNEIPRFMDTLASASDDEASADSSPRIVRETSCPMQYFVSPESGILRALVENKTVWRLHREICGLTAETMTLFVVQSDNSFLLAAGSKSIQVDDVAALLLTLRAPLIMRTAEKAKGKFQVVGVAHIPGLMQGELCLGDDAQAESITLV
ncbi:hypothetical protein B0A49_09163 [Cryomyces minteri]|uniref:Heterokaryon incompatibility domain-containing protein n=1 Tax=Cryomyces minteri TaxID=331657 RepID=A0A4U0WL25_9PEZI|nr:hypothetical protein B0A49_09163 [Cryomyces minteri]